MKILHVVKKYPPALGGDAVVVANLERQQQATGHRVAIVTSNCNKITSNVRHYTFGFKDTSANLDRITFKRLASLVILSVQMFTILRKERPDVIHSHSIDMAFCISFAARVYAIPIIHTFHIVTFYDPHQSLLRRKAELWIAKAAKLPVVTAPNTYDVKKLQTAGLSQTKLLPNGVDTTFWRSNFKVNRDDIFTFVSVGRLEQQKGYEYLVRAAALLIAKKTGRFRVIIVGEGSQKITLRKLIQKLQLQDIVTLAGRKSPEQIRNLFSEADAAVFPSLYETTPLTMLEAWAAALPVIVTEVGIVRDKPLGFEAAFVVQIGNKQALMQAMQRCMADLPSRNLVATQGHAEAQKYSWPAIAQTANMLYRSVQ